MSSSPPLTAEAGADNPVRVVGASVSLGDTQPFFEARAARGDLPDLNKVCYQDADPELASARNEAECRFVLPLLGTDPDTTRVLDVGCGTGRWAQNLRGRVRSYHGVDFSPSLVELAARHLPEDPDWRVECLDARELASLTGPYDVILIAGVACYLDDVHVGPLIEAAHDLLAPGGVLWHREPVSLLDQRLTLRNVWSEELQATYSAVYRTPEEYRAAAEPVPALDQPLWPELWNRAETGQWMWLYRKACQ